MAPVITPRLPTGEYVRKLSRSISSTLSKLSVRDIASSTQPLCSVFALVLTPSSSLPRRALTSITDLSSQSHSALVVRSGDTLDHLAKDLLERRQSFILAIPTTYAGLNSGPPPGTVVGATLGAVAGFILLLYIIVMTSQFVGNKTVVQEEVIVKRRSRSHSKSRKSSHHTPPHEPSPPPPPRSRRETIVEIEENIIHHSHHPSPSPSLEEVIVEEEETVSDEVVEVIEEQSSVMSPSPPPRKPSASARRSGYRVVDPAEFGGGDEPMRRIDSRRSSRRN